MKGDEENRNKNRRVLPGLCCVSGAPAVCCTHQRGICHPGVELGTEACLAPRRAGARGGLRRRTRMQDGTRWWHRLAGRTASATPPHSLFKDRLPREPPNSKTNRFFLQVLAINFSLCRRCLKRVVWLSDGTAGPRGFLVSPLLSSALPQVPPLQAAPHFSLRHPWGPVELYPALGRLLEISSADIWTPCLPSAMRAGHLKADSQARGTDEWCLWGVLRPRASPLSLGDEC